MATELIEQEPVAAVPQLATKAPPTKRASKKKKPRAKKAPAKKVVAKKATKKRVAKKPARKKRASKKPPAAAKKSVRKKSAAKKPNSKKRKAKKQPGTSKAQAIRDIAKELGRKARPRDIIAALAEKGIKVVSAQVSMTLKAAGMRRRRRRRKVVMAVAARQASRNGKSQAFNVDDLIQVRELAAKIGGLDKLKESVAALEKLQSIWFGV